MFQTTTRETHQKKRDKHAHIKYLKREEKKINSCLVSIH